MRKRYRNKGPGVVAIPTTFLLGRAITLCPGDVLEITITQASQAAEIDQVVSGYPNLVTRDVWDLMPSTWIYCAVPTNETRS